MAAMTVEQALAVVENAAFDGGKYSFEERKQALATLREAAKDAEYRAQQMRVVWNFVSPNESNDMGWADEIIVAIQNMTSSDSFRLDWMDSSAFTAYRERDPDNGELYGHVTLVNEDAPGSRVGIVCNTIREAIDAAMGEQP